MIDLLQGDAWREEGLTTHMKMPNDVPVTATDENSTGEVGTSEKLAGKEDIQVGLEEDRSENINSLELSGSTETHSGQDKNCRTEQTRRQYRG